LASFAAAALASSALRCATHAEPDALAAMTAISKSARPVLLPTQIRSATRLTGANGTRQKAATIPAAARPAMGESRLMRARTAKVTLMTNKALSDARHAPTKRPHMLKKLQALARSAKIISPDAPRS